MMSSRIWVLVGVVLLNDRVPANSPNWTSASHIEVVGQPQPCIPNAQCTWKAACLGRGEFVKAGRWFPSFPFLGPGTSPHPDDSQGNFMLLCSSSTHGFPSHNLAVSLMFVLSGGHLCNSVRAEKQFGQTSLPADLASFMLGVERERRRRNHAHGKQPRASHPG